VERLEKRRLEGGRSVSRGVRSKLDPLRIEVRDEAELTGLERLVVTTSTRSAATAAV
jgi:hypothetical protein